MNDEPFDYAAWMTQHAPFTCDEHVGGVRLGWSNVMGHEGFAYRCGCFWGSDDGRGEGWSRGVTSDIRDEASGVVSDGYDTPVSVRVRNGRVELYACDNYGDDPQVLTPEAAREVAAALIKAANDVG